MGKAALDQLGGGDDFVPGLHSARRPLARPPLHRPLPRGAARSGASARATAATRSSARSASRCASPATMARDEGWMAEHMLILELELPGRRGPLRRRGVPLGLRQDQPRHAGLAARGAGLQGADGRRRHRLAAARAPTAGSGRSTPRPASSASCPGTGPETNPNAMATIAHDTIFTNVAVTPRRRPVVGRQGQEPARGPPRLAGQALGRHAARPRTPTRASPSPRASARACRRAGRTRRACRSRRSSSAAAARASRRWSSRACDWDARRLRRRHDGLGDHGRGHRAGRRRAPRPDGDAAVLRLQHGRLLRPLAAHGHGARAARPRSST